MPTASSSIRREPLGLTLLGACHRNQHEKESPMYPAHEALEKWFEDRLPADAKRGDPTPLEIHRACLRIQATWSEEERRQRAGVHDSLAAWRLYWGSCPGDGA